jgi:hypothetical protein
MRPLSKRKKGRMMKIMVNSLSKLNVGLHDSANPLSGLGTVLSVLLVDHDEPATYTEAMKGSESEKWLEAMKSETRSMYDNQVWTLVDIPSDCKAVENKWIFKKRTDADCNVIIYKARIVVKGF